MYSKFTTPNLNVFISQMRFIAVIVALVLKVFGEINN